MSIPFQYLLNKTTGQIKTAGFADLRSEADQHYELITAPLPPGAVFESNTEDTESKKAELLKEEFKNLFQSQPLEYQLKHLTTANNVLMALDHKNYKLAKYIIKQVSNGQLDDSSTPGNSKPNNATPPPNLSEKLLQILEEES